MKIVMLRKHGFTLESQDSVTVVGIYDDTVQDETILDEVFLEHGYVSEKKYSFHSNRTITKDDNKSFYHIDGSVEIHNNISISGLLKNPLEVY